MSVVHPSKDVQNFDIACNFFYPYSTLVAKKSLRCARRDIQNGIFFTSFEYSTVLRYDLPTQFGAFARAVMSR